ncbi:MAG: SDR family NAD(P)-dependent oxidoreductase [Rhodospirillales bacterium]|nr:SDR family NAD(P)-dependent oxidoreductase [Rhodospirillales bacterium]
MKGSHPHTPTGILITGASSGIGAALAEAYAQAGTVLFLSGRDLDRLERVAKKCRDRGAIVHTTVLDVTNAAAMRQWVQASDDDHPLDLVIANAGISGGMRPTSSGTGRDTVAEDIFATNIGGVLNTVSPALSRMQPRQRGQIAIMSSLAGLRGLPSAPAYSASKVAVRAYGEALRPLHAAHGIGISVILPGFVESRITDQNHFPMPLIMPAAKAARIIKRGLARNRARIAFPFPLYAMMWVLAALPPAIADLFLSRLPKKD